jgi:N-methylhydantoinase B
VVSALPPDGAVFAYWEQSQVIISAVLRALAPAVGEAAIAGDRGGADIHNANGVLPDGTPWLSAAQVGGEVGPFGGNRHGDADSQMLSYQANGIGVAVEAVESGAPVVVLRHEIVPDTGGPGYNRGGNSLLRDSLWVLPAQHHLMSLRYKQPPGFGVEDGGEGMTGGIWIWDGEGERAPSLGPDGYPEATPVAGFLDPETNAPSREGVYQFPYRVPFWETGAGAVLRYVNNGGGGFGDPFEREPERVQRDVRDGYVTIEGAARDYGVAVTGDPDEDPENLAIDLEETERLRAARRNG